MAAHTKYADLTQGIQNVNGELKHIQSKYDINLEIEVSHFFYLKFSPVAIKYLDNLNTENANGLRSLIENRDSNPRLIQDMRNLITNLSSKDDYEITKMIKVILQVDPFYETFMCESPEAQLLFEDSYLLHNIDTKELSIDFIDYAVKFVSKVYKQMFGKKDLSSDDEHSSLS
jgi:succinate dehydrogenase flavin-adding protein (antitoxin of CptAB toxin-antitoxin module)